MDLGELVISIRMRTDALEKGLQETQRKLQQQRAETQKNAQSMKELESSYTSVAAVASVAFAGIVAAVMSGVKAYNAYTNAMVGLTSVAHGVGADMSKLQNSVNDLTKDGLMPAAEAATALKNLLSRGFTDDQAVQMILRLKDAAAFGRQSALSFGAAVRSATEGIRNEMSILVDNAGVTKNISLMWKDYAAQIGKGVDSLTLAEKRQAEFNGIMQETKHQVGDATKFAAEFSGQQAALAAQTTKLSAAFGGAQIPVLQTLGSILQPILLFLTEWIKRNPELTATITTMIATITGLVAVVGAWTAASRILGVALGSLALNPIILGLTALAGVVVLVTSSKAKAAEETKKLAEAEAEYNRVVREGIQQNEIASKEKEIEDLKKLMVAYDEATAKLTELENKEREIAENRGYDINDTKLGDVIDEQDKLVRSMNEMEKKFIGLQSSAKTAARDIEAYTKAVKDAKTGTTAQINEQAKQIAMNAREMLSVQALIDQYNKAEKGSSDWLSAQEDLAKQFPQFSTAAGINIKAIEGLMIVKRQDIEVAWKSIQVKAQEIITTKQLAAAEIEAQIAATDQVNLIERKGRELAKLNGEIAALNALATGRPTDVTGVQPTSQKAPSGSSAYQNKALDDANRLLEHKKRLNELTLEDELATLQKILARNVKTADERMAIEERIYDVKKAIRDRDASEEQKAFDQRIKQLQNVAEDRIVSEQLTGDAEKKVRVKLYADLIAEGKRYLAAVEQDEKLTADQRREIQSQITDSVRQNVNERLQLERDYSTEVRQQQVAAVNQLSSGVQGALREKYQAERSMQEDTIRSAIEANDSWRQSSLDSIKAVYDARIQAAEQAADREIALLDQIVGAQIKAVQDELAALDEAEKQKTRAELDADDQKNANRLRALIDSEGDEFARAALQSQLNALLAEESKRHDQEQLADKKDVLKTEEQTLKDKLQEQTDAIKQQLADKKELLAADRDFEIAGINQIAESQKTALNATLVATQEHYDKLLVAKNLQAEAEKLIVQNQQTDIIALLQEFGSSYEITGQTLGEKMYAGFKAKVDQISSLIANINSQIDAARSAAVAAMNQAQAAASKAASGNSYGGVIGTLGSIVVSAVNSAMPKNLTVINQMDSKDIAVATVPLLTNASRQAGRST